MTGHSRLLQIVTTLTGLCMALAVFFLPITSLPLLSRLMGGTMVAPPSIVFAGLGLALWLPVLLVQRESLPREFAPLAAFVTAALVSSLLSFFLLFPPFKGNSPLAEIAHALITLIIGLTCYAAFALWYTRRERFTWLFRLVDLGGAVMLLWSLAQLYVLFLSGRPYPDWMIALQNALSTNSLLRFAYMHRANGFTFEPSWLAHQINVFFLPYWLAATLTGYTAIGKRLWHISVENLLLAGGIVVLLGSLSRIGLLTLLLLAAYLLFRFTQFLARILAKRFRRPQLAAIFIGMGLFVLYFLLAVGLVYGMSFADYRLAAIFNMEKIPSDWFALARNLNFAERVSYWSMGFHDFGEHPIFGVGLGNAGFFFTNSIPPAAPTLPEILKIQTQFTAVPNVKNLWLRLLGETGLVGFGLFAAWLTVLWRGSKFLQSKSAPVYRVVGWMGLLAIIALVGEGFSIDSFAMPYYWISFGILTAASFAARQEADLLFGNRD
jgi:O-antigen ligase